MNQQEIRAKLAAAVGGEDRFPGMFSMRTMRDTRQRARRELDGAAETATKTIGRVEAALEAEQLLEHSDFDRAEFVGRFVRKWAAWQHAGARCVNWMVTGPARFPVASNNKKLGTAHRRLGEYIEFYKRAPAVEIRKAKRARAQALGPAGLAHGELEDLRRRLAKREAAQGHMKAINALIRKHKLGAGDGARLSELAIEAGHADMNPNRCGMILQPSFGRPGYARYQLSNNNAEIRRLKERIAQVEAKAERIEQAHEPRERVAGDVRLVENTAIDRVQLFFPGKPSAEIRTQLKARGFRWSPREGAWQRQLTSNGINAANSMLEQLAAA